MLFAIGIVHISVVFMEQNAVPKDITAPQRTKPTVLCFTSEKAQQDKPYYHEICEHQQIALHGG